MSNKKPRCTFILPHTYDIAVYAHKRNLLCASYHVFPDQGDALEKASKDKMVGTYVRREGWLTDEDFDFGWWDILRGKSKYWWEIIIDCAMSDRYKFLLMTIEIGADFKLYATDEEVEALSKLDIWPRNLENKYDCGAYFTAYLEYARSRKKDSGTSKKETFLKDFPPVYSN